MSDAKKCDRCGGYYMKGIENGFRPSIEGLRIFGVRYVSGANQNIDKYDLCPKCAMKVWEYISKYDEPTEDHEVVKEESPVCADNEIGYDKGVDLKPHKKRIVSFEVVNKCSANISHLKEMYGIGMTSRNITVTYWPNFDTYLMTALVSSNNVEHQMVKGDVDYDTLTIDLLRFFEYLDMAYGNDDEEEESDG